MLEGQSAFSREGPLSAWVTLWMMIFQRLHCKGTLEVAVRELRLGAVRKFVRLPQGEQLSISTSACTQARQRVPLEAAERVGDIALDLAVSMWMRTSRFSERKRICSKCLPNQSFLADSNQGVTQGKFGRTHARSQNG